MFFSFFSRGAPAGTKGWPWLLWACLVLGVPAAFSQESQPEPPERVSLILEVQLEGVGKTEAGQIRSLLRSQPETLLLPETVSEDIKRIFALGFFSDVSAELEQLPGEGVILIFKIKEKPRIADIRLFGNKLLDNKELLKELKLQAGHPYARRLLAEDIERLREAYRKKGYFKVKVRSQLKRITPQSYIVELHIEETARLFITEIRTRNNTIYSELEIKRIMRSAEVDCFSWITDAGLFDEFRINQDLQVIASRYLSNGYIRLFIRKPEIKLVHNPEFSRIQVMLHLEEGAQYFVDNVDIAGDILGNKADLLELLGLEKGDVYDPFKQNRDRFRLSQRYKEQGYAFVRVEPEVKIDDNTKRVDVVYRILKGEKAYIGRIEFFGNRETRDFVMRREMEVRENELYNGRNLRISQENLQRLGYFSSGMRMESKPGEFSNILDIVTKVEETQTGTFQAQFGYSDVSGLLVSASISKGNLFGRGQTIRFSTTYGQHNVTEAFNLDFIEPHLFDSEFSSDSSVALTSRSDISELASGEVKEKYFSQGFGYPIIPLLRVTLNVAVTDRSYEIQVEEPLLLRTISYGLNWNSVNNPVFPSSGTNASLSIQQVGGTVLGGDTEYRRYRLQARKFLALNASNNLVLMGRMRLGLLDAVNENVIPLHDRFRLGGLSSLRGYNYAEVGGPYGNQDRSLNLISRQAYDEFGEPLLNSNGAPLNASVDARLLGLNEDQLRMLRSGGIYERLFNLELLFPLAGDNVRGVVFYDAGEVNAESEQYTLLGETEPGFFDLKQAYGFGIRLITPLGVFRFEYGKKVAPRPGEATDKFDFTISSLF